jgi:ferrous iron transport protein A
MFNARCFRWYGGALSAIHQCHLEISMSTQSIPMTDTCLANHLHPLTDLKRKESGILQELRGGAGFRSRLAALGFTPGTMVTMLQNRGHGPVIVTVRDTKIALGRGEAAKILVLPQQE